MDNLTPRIFLLAVVTAFFIQTVRAEGYIDVKLRTFSHDCREDASTSKCDPLFYLCLSRPRKTNSFKTSGCEYSYKKSKHFQNDGFINFQTIGDKRNVPVPWIIKFTDIYDSQIMFSVKVEDHDSGFLFGGNDHMVTMRKNMTLTAAAKESEAEYEYFVLTKSGNTFKYEIRLYCSSYYYGPKCRTYCKARNDYLGHYTCQEPTGAKLCIKGWEGDECANDVNECTLGYCKTGTCQNLPGDYECTCPPLITGKNCSVNQDPCETVACQNGGECLLKNTELGLTHTCLCPEGWTGPLCETRVNPCQSGPCQNAGTCTPSADMTEYSCYCPPSHTGEQCEIKTTTTTTTTTTPLPTTPKPTTTTTPQPTTTTTTTTSSTTTPPPTTTTSTTTTTTTTTTTPTTSTPSPTTEDDTTTEAAGAGGAVGRSKSETSETKSAKFEMWHGLVLGIFALIILLVIVVVFVKKRKNKKLIFVDDTLPPPSTTIIVYDQSNGGHLAFENSMYVETNRNNTEVERNQQQSIPPVPSRPPSDELFYPIKPEVSPAEYEVPSVGAEGATYDNSGFVKEKSVLDKQSTLIKASGVKQLSRAPTERAENNPYADFRSLTAKKGTTEGIDNTDVILEDQDLDHLDEFIDDDEDHYQELDEVAMMADLPPTLRVGNRKGSRGNAFVPPLRIESMIPQDLPPPPPVRNSPPSGAKDNPSPSFDYDDDDDDDDSINPYAVVNKSRHSIETLPVRGDYDVPAESRGSVISDTSGYDVPSGIGPRPGHYSVNGNDGIYDNPRNSGASSTLPEFNSFTSFTPSEYNVPSSLPATNNNNNNSNSYSNSTETKRPVGLIVTSDPFADDPFAQPSNSYSNSNNNTHSIGNDPDSNGYVTNNGLNNGGHTDLNVDDVEFALSDDSNSDTDDDVSDDDEPEAIKRLKDEVKNNLDFVLLGAQTPDNSNA